jgi:hypothetical protein
MSRKSEPRKPDLIAYVVTGGGERSYYHRIGAAWNNQAGGARLVLDAFPVNGELLLLPPREREDGQDG